MPKSLAVAVTLCAIGAAPAFAQSQAPNQSQWPSLSENQVRNFLYDLSQQAQRSVNASDWQGLQNWVQNNVSPDGQFAVKGAVISRKGGTFTYAGTLSAQQVQALQSSPIVGRNFIQAMADYSLGVDIRSVQILPNGEASALVTFQESARLDPAKLAQLQGGQFSREGRASQEPQQQAGQQPQPGQLLFGSQQMVFQSTSQCDLRLSSAGPSGQSGQAGQQANIAIKIAACDTTTTF